MKLDKKQIPQLIVLGILVIICIGYISFTVLKPKAVPPAPAQQAKKSAVDTNGEAAGNLRIVSTNIFPGLNTPEARRDPFAVQKLPGAELEETNFQPVMHSTSTSKPTQIVKIREQSGNVPPLIPITGNLASAQSNTTVPSQPGTQVGLTAIPVEEQDPQFIITGVIRGERNIAIIRVGNTERHVVKQGQIIDGRYKVLSVTEDGAVLACKNRRIYLKLGGDRNAS